MPKVVLPEEMVFHESHRWLPDTCCKFMGHEPSTVRAGYDGSERREGRTSTLPSTRWSTPWPRTSPRRMNRTGTKSLCRPRKVQNLTRESAGIRCLDHGQVGADPDADVASHGIHLVMGTPRGQEGIRDFAAAVDHGADVWGMARFRGLARDYERLRATLEALHYIG